MQTDFEKKKSHKKNLKG